MPTSSLMPYTTLLTCSELACRLTNPEWALVDCRFSLQDAERGRRDYEEAHIPGAIYAHLNKDLSGPIFPGKTGRHPLPEVNVLARTFSSWGIDSGVQVVAYDDAGGSMAATRLWWLLRWLGHAAVAVLNGGWRRWQREMGETRSGSEDRSARTFTPNPQPDLLADASDVLAVLQDPKRLLFDARSGDRYRGENETIDPVAGHIPGAQSVPYGESLGPDGLFLDPEALRARYQGLLGDSPADRAIFYCGSGVTAAHNLLAVAHAGLGNARLYSGAWSEWITDPNRPIRTGIE